MYSVVHLHYVTFSHFIDFHEQCCIDLKDNVLVIGTTGTRTLFLPESELPSNARLSTENEPEASPTQQLEDRDLAEALEKSAQESVAASSVTSQLPTAAVPETTTPFPEEKIQQIVQMGFSREDAISELRRCNGDVTLASASLLARSIKLPSS